MKKSLKHLTLLASMTLLLASCNEKISAELESGNSTTLPPVINPSTYYFKVTNESSILLNYNLHRTGPGRFGTNSWECGVSTPHKFEDTLFSSEGDPIANIPHDNKVYDVSCFLEAQEQDLYFNGASLQINASPNTCEYVAYVPFGYYERMPGKTTASFTGVVCNDEAIDDVHVATFGQVPTYGGGTKIGCNQMVDMNTPEALRQPQTVSDDDQQFCRFDYQESNCDSGLLSFNMYEVYNSAEEGDPTSPSIKPIPKSSHSCGGTAAACVAGPIRQHPELAAFTNAALIGDTTPNQKYEQTYELKAPIEVANGVAENYSLANFRKSLANRHLNFLNHDDATSTTWYDLANGKSYDPRIMENYSSNMAPNGARIVATSASHVAALIPYSAYETFAYALGYRTEPMAAEGFLGFTGSTVNPFYTFYCLDEAKETKARIRLSIREWDRVYPSDRTLFEEISDTYRANMDRRMDAPLNSSEIPGDPGYYMGYNDYPDWDDLIPMVRTNQFPYAPGVIWQPEAGFYAPENFPK